jgi:hypothetical protein
MAATTTITLDTLGPQNVQTLIEFGAPFATSRDVSVAISTDDSPLTGYTMKVWGDVDATFDANIQPAEVDSEWIGASLTVGVRVSPGDGPKSISVRLRDDVGNESSVATNSITLDTTLPVPTVTVEAAPEKISTVDGFDVSSFTFQVDSDISEWKVKAVPSEASQEGSGVTIPDTAGSVNTTGGILTAGMSREVIVHGADLKTASSADGTKVVKVFIRDTNGQWSV